MRYRLLGRSGLRVSELCLGAMTFGGSSGSGTDEPEARRIVERFAEAGGNFIDTAVNYADGASEEIVGRAVASDRDRWVISTKYTAPLRSGDPNSGGNHRKAMRQALERSLSRLRTDHIDLYWVHVWEGLTPIEEVLRTLDDAVSAGKILYVGISDVPAWVVSRADALATTRGMEAFSALQIEYSLLERTVERELTPMARALDLAVLAWGPLGRGLLTGKYAPSAPSQPRRLEAADRRLNERALAVAAVASEVAESIGATPAQVALAWLRQRSGVVIPIVGARTAEQLSDSLGCLEIDLDDESLEKLDAASRVELGFPHEFLASMRQSSYAQRSASGSVDNHRDARRTDRDA
jgi:aryl-alcohol dehydrogenase-like predicted oxidoreductase